ncbi:MAG: PIN domain-containing protein [Candidatus Hadarchaeum sp.]
MYLVDSGVWIAASNPKDKHHREAVPVLKSILSGAQGKAIITNLIFSEVTTYIRKKIGKKQSVEAARLIMDSEHVKIIFIDENIFNAAYHMFEKYPELSFADATSVAVMKDRDIRQIISFDRGFDTVRDINRLEKI